jgi:site-specific DNA-cytosine methylase
MAAWQVVDVNCGLGGASRGFAANGFEVVAAADCSDAAIEIGRRTGLLSDNAQVCATSGCATSGRATSGRTVVVVSGGDIETLSKILCHRDNAAVAFVAEGVDVLSPPFQACRSLVEVAGYDSVVFHADASFFSVPISRNRCYWVGMLGDPGGKRLEGFLRRLRGEQSRMPFGVRSSGFFFRKRCDYYFFGARAGLTAASIHSSHLPAPDLATRDILRPREGYRRQLFDAAPLERAVSLEICDVAEMHLGVSFPVRPQQEQEVLELINRTMPVALAEALARSLLPELPSEPQDRRQRASTRFDAGISTVIEERANRVQRIIQEHGGRSECAMMKSLVVRTNGTRVLKADAPFGCGVCSALAADIVGTDLPEGWVLEIRERKNSQFRKDDLYIRSPPGANAVVLRSRVALHRFLH